MNGILSSKGAAWLAFLLMIIVLVATFGMRTAWWDFFDIFFAFMMVFCHVIAVTITKYNKFAAARLDRIALVMGVLAVLSFIGEWIASECLK